MTIKDRLRTNALITVATALIIGLVLLDFAWRADELRSETRAARVILQQARALRNLALQFILFREGKAITRWQREQAAMAAALRGIRTEAADERQIVRLALEDQLAAKALLAQLAALNGAPATGPWGTAETVLVGQLLVKTQELVSRALELDAVYDTRARRAATTADAWIFALVAALAVVTTGLSWYLARSIGGPLARLTEGARAIGAGNLEHRIGLRRADELGALAGTFDGMAENLERARARQQEAALALQQAGAYTRSLLEASLDPLVTISPEGKITDVNEATVKITGVPREILIGTDFADYFTEPDKAHEHYQRVYAEGFVTNYPLTIRHEDGHLTDVVYNASVYRDADGNALGVFAAARDITERKRAEEKLRRSEHSLAEAQRMAHLGNWELDLANNTLEWSDEIYRVFEIDPERFGASYEAFLDAIHPDDRNMVNKAYTESVESRTPYDIVHRLLMKDGRVKYVNERCETYYDDEGKPLRSVGTVHDITERVRAEDEIRALNRDLEQRVAARTAELEDANADLESFAYSVSHDLRTPLRAIDGFSRIVLEEYSDNVDEEGQRLLNVVRDNTVKMGSMINDILLFSRAGRLELKPVEIDMDTVVRSAWDELAPTIGARKIRFEAKPLPKACADHAALTQVVTNLLGNAVKFTRPRDPAVIEVGGSEADGENVYYVKDNGVGFDMQYSAKLFGVFQRLHGTDKFEGAGIGLAIVKRVADKHGGRVWAEGEVDKGATFYFALPRREPCEGGAEEV
jgi:PAS domain S-box-containing protein